MGTETELKLLVSGDVQDVLENTFIATLNAQCDIKQFTLFNQYFDTPDRHLRKHDIGFRVRSQGKAYEQTIKTAGKQSGGLHKRPEFNIPLPNQRPDLTLFDPDIWPDNLSISRLQAQLECLFSTDFERREYCLTFDNGDVVELVYDRGQIEAGSQTTHINEVELELKSGPTVRLLEVAEQLSGLIPVQIGNLSKAARGYMLADNKTLRPKALGGFLPVRNEDTCEAGFIKAVEFALAFWQHHEQCYLYSNKVKDLSGVREGMGLMLQAMALYLPSLQCDALLDIHKSLLLRCSDWYWLEQLLASKELRSKRGPFRKKLARNDELVSYLYGLTQGILNDRNPKAWILEKANAKLQLRIARLLLDKPWRKDSTGYTTTLSEHAKGWLSQGWHNVLQSMPINRKMASQDYLAQQSLLRQTTYNGFMLGALFSEKREQFRAPWLDILDGIEELKTLSHLQLQLAQTDLTDKQDLQTWCKEKIANLLAVMEQSRAVGLRMEAYW